MLLGMIRMLFFNNTQKVLLNETSMKYQLSLIILHCPDEMGDEFHLLPQCILLDEVEREDCYARAVMNT